MDNKRCFIVGMGPSLRISDLDALHSQNEISIGCNKCYLAFDKTAWRPTYYFVAARGVTENLQEKIANISLEIPTFVYSRSREHIEKHTHKVNFCDENLSFDDGNGLRSGYTVITMMLHFAFKRRFNPIYLIGVDFSYSYDETKVVTRGGSVLADFSHQNHFIDGYCEPGELCVMFQPEKQIPIYEDAHRQCQNAGIRVYNASRHSKLEVFPRANLDEVLQEANDGF